jgi:hypothetical protein
MEIVSKILRVNLPDVASKSLNQFAVLRVPGSQRGARGHFEVRNRNPGAPGKRKGFRLPQRVSVATIAALPRPQAAAC